MYTAVQSTGGENRFYGFSSRISLKSGTLNVSFIFFVVLCVCLISQIQASPPLHFLPPLNLRQPLLFLLQASLQQVKVSVFTSVNCSKVQYMTLLFMWSVNSVVLASWMFCAVFFVCVCAVSHTFSATIYSSKIINLIVYYSSNAHTIKPIRLGETQRMLSSC